ncbi:PaaI family thioesterase [Aldersonia kunmingensis]|uniref:PaaI family thioesterase n=1 Tax=Aldersonia kunmingensis TaxID=408066 RepID=UPI00082CAB8D|nr:PaaI family thioesterase [Aldersonia kunmingensis]
MTDLFEASDVVVGARPSDVFGVGNVVEHADVISAEQWMSGRFADHRGRIDLPALAFLFDHVCGMPFYRAVSPEAASLQARLSVSMCGEVAVGDRVVGQARLRKREGDRGTSSVEISAQQSGLCCIGTARSVRVGRAAQFDPISTESVDVLSTNETGFDRVPTPDSGLAGIDVVTQIARGDRAAGPIVELLDARVVDCSGLGDRRGYSVRFVSTTAEWMGNTFGTMHGGLIATIAAQACSLAAQAHTAPGQEYRLDDFNIGFFRSPEVNGSDINVDVTPVKVGRRIVSLEATMTADDGTLLSRATADASYS